MSSLYASAQQLTSVTQRYPGFRAASQNVVDGRIVAQKLTDGVTAFAPHRAPPARRPGMAPEQARYTLLNNIKQTQPNSGPGRAAQSLLAQEKVFARRPRSASVQRWRQARASTVIHMAAQNPQLIKAADPTNRLREAINMDRKPLPRRSDGPRTPRPYDSMREGPRFTASLTETKVVSWRELPVRPRAAITRALTKVALAAMAPAPAA